MLRSLKSGLLWGFFCMYVCIWLMFLLFNVMWWFFVMLLSCPLPPLLSLPPLFYSVWVLVWLLDENLVCWSLGLSFTAALHHVINLASAYISSSSSLSHQLVLSLARTQNILFILLVLTNLFLSPIQNLQHFLLPWLQLVPLQPRTAYSSAPHQPYTHTFNKSLLTFCLPSESTKPRP